MPSLVLNPRPRGAIPTPRHQLAAAIPFRGGAAPTSFGVVPSQLSYWGNNQYGDCVPCEEAFAKAAWSVMAGYPELFISDAILEAWAQHGGFLNGALLPDVMTAMATNGIAVDGVTYTDGPARSVDYTDWATLTAAIAQGPIKIGVAADQLQGTVGTVNGWVGTGWHADSNEDHCVSLCGYGTFQECFGFLKLPVPAVPNAGAQWLLLFTWNTIGVVDFASMQAIAGEAWLRNITTPQQPVLTPPAPVPVPVPTPTPTPGDEVVTSVVNVSTRTVQLTTPPDWLVSRVE